MRLLKRISVAALMLGLLASGVARADTITCRFDVNDVRQAIEIRHVDDVYTFEKIDLPGDFRFAGQWLPALNKFKAYVYHTPSSRYVLLTQQEFELSGRSCTQDFGRHRVYDSANEREMYFHCSRSCRDTMR